MSTPHPSHATDAPYCELCGLLLQPQPTEDDASLEEKHDGGHAPPSYHHSRCADLLQLEPPRYCAFCGRRLRVQVSPTGWWASCARHGRNAS